MPLANREKSLSEREAVKFEIEMSETELLDLKGGHPSADVLVSDKHFSSQAKRNRRDRLVLLSAMLSRAAKGVCKTELMYKVGLSSAQIDKYIPVLVASDLLEVFNHTKRAVYRTTEKGKSFVKILDTLVKLLD